MAKAKIKFTRAVQKSVQAQQAKTVSFPAVLGDVDGVVLTATDGIVNVTPYNGDTIQVLNRRVQNKPFLQVLVGFDDDAPGILQVLALRDAYGSLDTDPLVPDHAKTHAYGGGDTVFVAAAQIKPFLVLPYDGLEVQVMGGIFQKPDTTFGVVDNQVLDLSGEVPGTGALYCLIEYDEDGVVSATSGSTVVSKEVLALSDIPAVTNRPICVVRLYAGQTEIQRNPNTVNDFLDIRFEHWVSQNTLAIDGYPVDLSTYCVLDPQDGDVLLFDGCNLTWYPASSVPLALNAQAIDGIVVDNDPAPTDGQVLTYDVHTDTYRPEDSGGGGGGGAGTPIFQRVLSASLTLDDGECMVITQYIELGAYNLTLDGDASLEIL